MFIVYIVQPYSKPLTTLLLTENMFFYIYCIVNQWMTIGELFVVETHFFQALKRSVGLKWTKWDEQEPSRITSVGQRALSQVRKFNTNPWPLTLNWSSFLTKSLPKFYLKVIYLGKSANLLVCCACTIVPCKCFKPSLTRFSFCRKESAKHFAHSFERLAAMK